MPQWGQTLLFGGFFLAVGLVIWYGAYHPPMAYQRAKMANPTRGGLRRRRVAVVVIVVTLTTWGVFLGWVLPPW
jgi:hypothetical protein